MPLIEVKVTGASSGYRRWVNTKHIVEIVEGRDGDWIKLIGSAHGTYSVGIASAATVARDVINAETQVM